MRERDVLRLARGKPCMFQFPGVCNGNSETTVPAHLPMKGIRGTGQKAPPLCVGYACFDCHRFIDARDLTAQESRLRKHMIGNGEWFETLYAGLMRTLAEVWREVA